MRYQEKMTSEAVPLDEAKKYQIVVQLTAQYNTSPNRIVLDHTVYRTLSYTALHRRHPAHVPLFTKRYRQLRLQWAKKNYNCTMNEWERVAWSESHFIIHHVNGRGRVSHVISET